MKNFTILAAITAAGLMLSGCAEFDPIIDEPAASTGNYVPAGYSNGYRAEIAYETYEHALATCRRYSDLVDGNQMMARNAGQGVFMGAVTAGIGMLLSGGNNWGPLAASVAEGALSGAWTGADQARQTRESVVRECLRDRGYRVIN